MDSNHPIIHRPAGDVLVLFDNADALAFCEDNDVRALRDEGLRSRWASEARSVADRYDIRATVTAYLRTMTELTRTAPAP